MILGIGVDIVRVARMSAAISKHGDKFLNRVFCEQEIANCSKRVEPTPCYAARFAAKEAYVKALGTGFSKGITLAQVCVEKLATGAPTLKPKGAALKAAKELGVARIHLSLTHEKDAAVAVVIIEGE